MNITLLNAFCPVSSLGISYLCQETEHNRWTVEGKDGEEEKQQLPQLFQVKEKLHPCIGLKRLCCSFSSLCLCLSKRKIWNGGNWGRLCIVTKILSSLDIWQQVKKQNTDDNSICSSLSVPSLPKTDLPSQIPSFLV